MALFKPGQSGNPTGRPKQDPRLTEMAKGHTKKAMDVVIACLADNDPRIALRAAEIVLDRGWGRPAQMVDMTVRKEDVTQMSDSELAEVVARSRKAQEADVAVH